MKLFLFLLMSVSLNAQILERYPDTQVSYTGGDVLFYRDFHRILQDQKIAECDNKNEMYVVNLVVYEDASVKIVKEQNTEKLSKNKCTYETVKKVLAEMKGWNPAIYKGKKMAAVTQYHIYLDDLFDNYSPEYAASKYFTQPEFPGGLQRFRNKFTGAIRIPKLDHTDGEFTLEIAFDVDEQGQMQDVRLLQNTGYKHFDDSIITGIEYMKKKYQWKPATFHGHPITKSITVPIHFTFH